jgi:hypothetical protein
MIGDVDCGEIGGMKIAGEIKNTTLNSNKFLNLSKIFGKLFA